MDRKMIDKLIWAHSVWKNRLEDVINGKKTDVTIKQAGNFHECEFGQWLDSSDGRSLPDHDNISKMHAQFHQEAAEILSLATSGKQNEAREKMEFGNSFSLLTARVINVLNGL